MKLPIAIPKLGFILLIFMLSTFWASCNKHKKIDIYQNDKPTKKQMKDGASDRLASGLQPGDGHMGSKNMDINHTAADAQGKSNTPTESMHAPTASLNQSSEQKRKLGLFGGMGNWTDKRLRKVKQYVNKKFKQSKKGV